MGYRQYDPYGSIECSWMNTTMITRIWGQWCPRCGEEVTIVKSVKSRKHWWSRKIKRVFWECSHCDFTENFHGKGTILYVNPKEKE